MIKAGIFIDVENLSRSGGWGIRFSVIKDIAQAQGAIVVRANAYLAVDAEREGREPEYRRKNEDYRAAIRALGYRYGESMDLYDLAAVGEFWSPERAAYDSGGRMVPGWTGCARAKPTALPHKR